MEWLSVSSVYISKCIIYTFFSGLSNQEKAKRAVWFGIAGMGLSVFTVLEVVHR